LFAEEEYTQFQISKNIQGEKALRHPSLAGSSPVAANSVDRGEAGTSPTSVSGKRLGSGHLYIAVHSTWTYAMQIVGGTYPVKAQQQNCSMHRWQLDLRTGERLEEQAPSQMSLAMHGQHAMMGGAVMQGSALAHALGTRPPIFTGPNQQVASLPPPLYPPLRAPLPIPECVLCSGLGKTSGPPLPATLSTSEKPKKEP